MYDEAVVAYGAALERLARSYERDAEKRQDLVSLEAIDAAADATDTEQVVDQRLMMDRVRALRPRLQPPDRQLMLLSRARARSRHWRAGRS